MPMIIALPKAWSHGFVDARVIVELQAFHAAVTSNEKTADLIPCIYERMKFGRERVFGLSVDPAWNLRKAVICEVPTASNFRFALLTIEKNTDLLLEPTWWLSDPLGKLLGVCERQTFLLDKHGLEADLHAFTVGTQLKI